MLEKCSRCELNYKDENEPYCSICMKELRGEVDDIDRLGICTECGENPAIPGHELCRFCMPKEDWLESSTSAEPYITSVEELRTESTAGMEELTPDEADESIASLAPDELMDIESELEDVVEEEDYTEEEFLDTDNVEEELEKDYLSIEQMIEDESLNDNEDEEDFSDDDF